MDLGLSENSTPGKFYRLPFQRNLARRVEGWKNAFSHI